jgi:peptide/nickel transport system permease protein
MTFGPEHDSFESGSMPVPTGLAGVETAPAADPSVSAWRLALRAVIKRRAALVAAVTFAVIVLACALAPIYADDVAHTGPNTNHLQSSLRVDGREVPIVSSGGVQFGVHIKLTVGGAPIGPQWLNAGGRFLLGADENGRDVAVRLLYGGRTSLEIALAAAAICMVIGLVMSLIASFYGGWIDWLIGRIFDVMWAFPVILLGVALGAVLSINGFHHFGINVGSGNLLIPIAIIAFAFVPYVGRPLRGQLLSVRRREFVSAAIADGVPVARLMLTELVPNVASTVLVLVPLTVANDIILEAGLSFLGAGVQPPNASWGTLIAEGQQRIVTAPWLALIPGVAMLLTSLSLNILGDAVRDALDPRSRTVT